MRRLLLGILPLAIGGLAFVGLPAPFAWGTGGAFLGAVGLVRLSKRRRARRAWTVVASLTGLWAILEVALPGPPAPPEPCDHTGPGRSEYEVVHPVLGTAPTPGIVIPASGMRGNKVFDGVYTIDANGLRISHPSTADEAILFFGCSYTYGLNVGDEETFAYLASRELAPDYRCYNFGYPAYGAQQMLAALQSGMVADIVAEKPRLVVYLLINSHVRRAVRDGWSPHAPRYVIGPGGEAIAAGRLCEPPVAPPEGLEAILLRSAAYREVVSHTLPRHVDTLVAILRTARDEVERRFPGCRFEILYWERASWKQRRLMNGLQEAGIPVHLAGDILPGFTEDYYKYFLGEDDFHPNREAHQLLADFIVDRVRTLDEQEGRETRAGD
jgi:hypothetical protein